jgi:hypothetical protein
MTTLSDLRTQVARDLRDSGNATWTTTELDDLINEGVDALADFYPKEIVSTFATVAAATYSYSASTFSSMYRLDIHNSGATYLRTLPHGIGAGPNSGWEMHGSVVYLPPNLSLTAGELLRGFGYGRYTQLSASSSTTDLDTSGVWAVREFAVAEGYSRLLIDRALFQQWQGNSNATDIGAIQLASLAEAAQRKWDRQKVRLRRPKKTG